MAAISQNLEYLGLNFALHSGTTQDTCVQKIMGISAKLRPVGWGQRSLYRLWILTRRRPSKTYRSPIFMWDKMMQVSYFAHLMLKASSPCRVGLQLLRMRKVPSWHCSNLWVALSRLISPTYLHVQSCQNHQSLHDTMETQCKTVNTIKFTTNSSVCFGKQFTRKFTQKRYNVTAECTTRWWHAYYHTN